MDKFHNEGKKREARVNIQKRLDQLNIENKFVRFIYYCWYSMPFNMDHDKKKLY